MSNRLPKDNFIMSLNLAFIIIIIVSITKGLRAGLVASLVAILGVSSALAPIFLFKVLFPLGF